MLISEYSTRIYQFESSSTPDCLVLADLKSASMIATFILFLREGLEASIIVSILFAVIRQLGQIHQARAIWTGVCLAILGSLLGGLTIYLTVHTYVGSTFQTIF